MQFNRRTLLTAAALLPLSTLPINAPKAATNVMWQSWPIGSPRPSEFVTGTTTISRLLKRLRDAGPNDVYHIVRIY